MNERSKARHRAEALKAIQIGRELNDPSGLVPDHEAQEALFGGDGSDENEPLANLPSRGSMLGGMGRGPAAPGSVMSGFGGAPGGLPGVGVGGQYSHLAIPPPGVDPYLCEPTFAACKSRAILSDTPRFQIQMHRSLPIRRCRFISALSR